MSEHPADRPNVPRRPPDLSPAQPQRRTLPPYRVVLLQDARNDLMFVIRTVMELTRYCRAEATHKMWQAHHHGRSVLLVTYKERAELYVEQFASRGLDVIIEPA
ncbi:MAG TPA: ATP-dependent Clp protease adaptor ClpS [Gemmataceae bacterium]|nr:ATP-dependent Clp protease adaptor ClpS [Gemmataceae bacterium]